MNVSILKSLGPGILMAGAAIGVSHLVQATRAGANYGFSLLLVVLLVNLLKYPFFFFGHYYTAREDKNLLEGYYKMGKNYLILFILLNSFTAVTSIAGVFFVTAALIQNIIFFPVSTNVVTFFLLIFCAFLIGLGRYGLLDKTMKVMMSVLFITTVVAFGYGFQSFYSNSVWETVNFFPKTYLSLSALPFIIALMGWMPAPIELSVWQSLWMKEKEEREKKKITFKEAVFDFNFGYVLTTLLALIFLLLGAFIMYPRGENFPENPVAFSQKLLELYTLTVGDWMKGIVAVAAFAAMFSTSLTVLDAYPKSVFVSLSILKKGFYRPSKRGELFSIICFSVLSLIIICFYAKGLKSLVDLVTIISFISAPPFAYLNFKLIYGKKSRNEISIKMKILKFVSYLGLLYLTIFAGIFIYYSAIISN